MCVCVIFEVNEERLCSRKAQENSCCIIYPAFPSLALCVHPNIVDHGSIYMCSYIFVFQRKHHVRYVLSRNPDMIFRLEASWVSINLSRLICLAIGLEKIQPFLTCVKWLWLERKQNLGDGCGVNFRYMLNKLNDLSFRDLCIVWVFSFYLRVVISCHLIAGFKMLGQGFLFVGIYVASALIIIWLQKLWMLFVAIINCVTLVCTCWLACSLLKHLPEILPFMRQTHLNHLIWLNESLNLVEETNTFWAW